MIGKLKDNAELAMASYGYYDLIGKKLKMIEKNMVIKEINP